MTGDALALHLQQLEDIEHRGIELLDAGANPAKMAADLLAVLTRLMLEGRFTQVDIARVEDVLGDVAEAQIEDLQMSPREKDWATFRVSVVGEFPFDMLRHDQCWPVDPDDAAQMMGDVTTERREVTLATWNGFSPHVRRWESFCCRVVFCSRDGGAK